MEQERRRSLLGASLNTAYGPCSVAAAELVRSAHSDKNNILHKAHYPERVIVSDLDAPVQMRARAAELKNTHQEDTSGGTRSVSKGIGIYLSQDVRIEKVPVESETTIHRTFRKPKVVPYTVMKEETHFGDIWLADGVLGGKILMPIATFQDRTDGQCKYVDSSPFLPCTPMRRVGSGLN